MRPDEYEQIVATHFEELGYSVSITPHNNDYGVDVFATDGDEKIAIQAKMYGSTSRKINRQMVMELYGAMVYFDCDRAIIATDGELLSSAREVSEKLGIEVIHIPAARQTVSSHNSGFSQRHFESYWEKYVFPLRGKTLSRRSGKTNTLLEVNWSGVTRLTSNGRRQHIDIEVFRMTFYKLLESGFISRDLINQEYAKRASSGVVLILSSTPLIEETRNPTGLRYTGNAI